MRERPGALQLVSNRNTFPRAVSFLLPSVENGVVPCLLHGTHRQKMLVQRCEMRGIFRFLQLIALINHMRVPTYPHVLINMHTRGGEGRGETARAAHSVNERAAGLQFPRSQRGSRRRGCLTETKKQTGFFPP